MYDNSNKKVLIFLILEILQEYTDANHRLEQQEIVKLLHQKYGVKCDRRTVKNNIIALIDFGYNISIDDGYCLLNRKFDDAELRMLIDSVLFSKTISKKQAKVLIDKLKSMTNKFFTAKVSHISNLPELQRTDNKQVMYSLDVLNDAISKK